jgi:hypothetical protein
MPSSVIYKVTYDVSSSTLRIIFVSGNVYDYMNVPAEVYKSIRQAPSKGTYFNQSIKGRYPFRRVQ